MHRLKTIQVNIVLMIFPFCMVYILGYILNSFVSDSIKNKINKLRTITLTKKHSLIGSFLKKVIIWLLLNLASCSILRKIVVIFSNKKFILSVLSFLSIKFNISYFIYWSMNLQMGWIMKYIVLSWEPILISMWAEYNS